MVSLHSNDSIKRTWALVEGARSVPVVLLGSRIMENLPSEGLDCNHTT